MSRLEVKGIEKHFGGVAALSRADLTIEKGTVCGLLGANGSGKTTLSRIISGLYRADGGEMYFEGRKVSFSSSKDAAKAGIAMAHQNLSLVNDLTVWENICLGQERMKGLLIDSGRCIKEAEKILEMFGLKGFESKKISELSPSQKQLVEISKAIFQKPKLLILDEPTASLEFAQVSMLFRIITKIKEEGMSVVFISHRMWEVTQLCDTVAVLKNGETVSTFDLREIREEDQHQVLLRAITGKEEQPARLCDTEARKGKAALTVNALNIKGLLHDISFEIAEGEIVGISGLQGMGQEELLLALSGFLKRNSGKILYRGASVKWSNAKQAIKDGIVLIPGDRHMEGLFLGYSVFDNLLYPHFCKRKSPFFVSLKTLGKTTDELMEKIRLVPRNGKIKVNNLSGGNQQKVVLGKWISQSPEIMLMSDPAKGIDVEARRELYGICKEFACNGKSVLLYASDNHELIDICDRVLVMFEGKIVAEILQKDLSDAKLIEAALHMNSERGAS